MSVEQFQSYPPVESCRIIPFETCEIQESNPPMLVVRGEAPCANMEVHLQPRIYIHCPEYWGIEVVGCLPGSICLTAIKPYEVCLPLTGIVGSEGIEVIGANKTEKKQVSGGCKELRADFKATG